MPTDPKAELTPADCDKLLGTTGTVRDPQKGPWLEPNGKPQVWKVVGYSTDPADDGLVKTLKLETVARRTGVQQIVDNKRVGAPLMVKPEDVGVQSVVVPERPDFEFKACPVRWFTAGAPKDDDEGDEGKARRHDQVKQPQTASHRS